MFDYVSNLEQGLVENYKIGATVAYESMEYRLDSMNVSADMSVFDFSKDEHLVVYLTITNNGLTPYTFATLTKLKIVDDNKTTYTQDLTAKSDSLKAIAPNTSGQAFIAYKIPKTAKGLMLQYQLNVMREDYWRFDLGDVWGE